MNNYTFFRAFIFTVLLSGSCLYAQSHDGFEDGTTQGWTNGINAPDPTNVPNGGPSGAGDNYLQVTSDGVGQGGRLIVFNATQWTGDFTSGGILDISFHVNNLSSTTNIDLRISLMVSGGTVMDDNFWCSSTNPVSISASSGWNSATFPIAAGNLTALGTTSIAAILSNVGQMRILDASGGPSRQGDLVVATLGLDNISVGDVPLPVELSSFQAIGEDNKVVLLWSTASEIDNLGFAILRADVKDSKYDEIDSYKENNDLKGAGNSSSQNNYQYIDESVFNGDTYWYKLVDIDLNGVRTEHGPVYATPHGAEVIEVNNFIPQNFALYQNKPNPFNPNTKIEFDVAELHDGAIQVNLAVYNLLGQHVANLFSGVIDAGVYISEWDGLDSFGKNVPSGIYIYRIDSENFSQSKRMILLK